MILGSKFFITPSDSVAMIAANAQQSIPYFKDGILVRACFLQLLLLSMRAAALEVQSAGQTVLPLAPLAPCLSQTTCLYPVAQHSTRHAESAPCSGQRRSFAATCLPHYDARCA